MVDAVVELVLAAPWSEIVLESEDVVESVVIDCSSTDWEVEVDEELAEGLTEAGVKDVLLS